MLRPGFHVAAFFTHRSSGNDAILIVKSRLILLCVSIQHGIVAASILSIAVAVLFYVFDPIFLFDLARVTLFIGVFRKGNVAVLGRDRDLNCYLRQFLRLSFCCLFFPSSSSSCLLRRVFSLYYLVGRLGEAFCAESIVSFFRVLLIVSQRHNSTSA